MGVYKEILQIFMKAGRSGSLLCCITSGKTFFLFHISTVADLLCSFGVELTCCTDYVMILCGVYAFSGT